MEQGANIVRFPNHGRGKNITYSRIKEGGSIWSARERMRLARQMESEDVLMVRSCARISGGHSATAVMPQKLGKQRAISWTLGLNCTTLLPTEDSSLWPINTALGSSIASHFLSPLHLSSQLHDPHDRHYHNSHLKSSLQQVRGGRNAWRISLTHPLRCLAA